jgi:hypothetical protein
VYLCERLSPPKRQRDHYRPRKEKVKKNEPLSQNTSH